MTISLEPELQQFLEQQVRSGRFASTDLALAEAVRLMKQREEKLDSLRREIDLGLEDVECGRVSEWNADEAKARLRKRLEDESRA